MDFDVNNEIIQAIIGYIFDVGREDPETHFIEVIHLVELLSYLTGKVWNIEKDATENYILFYEEEE